ncbi:hypothetical protein NP031_18115, partial [Salmonella enterica]|nr:hypothetical protein [Salmonella enterica]
MELYVSKTSQQNMPVEFNIYYSRSKTLVGIVFWICMMGVFIALAVSMATDPEEPKTVLTPESWTVKHEAYRSDSDIQLESD